MNYLENLQSAGVFVCMMHLPAMVSGDDYCVTYTGSSQAVPEFMEKSVEQRLQRQDQQKHAHKDAAGGLNI